MPSNQTANTRQNRLLYKLCQQYGGKKQDLVIRLYRMSVDYLKDAPKYSCSRQNELLVVEKIKTHLKQRGKVNDVDKFTNLHHQLESTQGVLKRPQALLCLMERLCLLPEPNSAIATPKMFELPQNVPLRSSPHVDMIGQSGISFSYAVPSSDEYTLQKLQDMSLPKPPVSTDLGAVTVSRAMTQSTFSLDLRMGLHDPTIPFVGESKLLECLVFAFQGIPSDVLKLDPVMQDFKLNPEMKYSPNHRQLVLRLAELGWLHIQLRNFCDEKGKGRMHKSMVAAIREELTEYYRLVALVEGQIQRRKSGGDSDAFTLRRLLVWAIEPMNRLKLLVSVVKACGHLQGGALASCVHGFLQHGNPFVRATVKNLLALVCKPMYAMLSRWMLDGELDDPCREFFIVDNVEVKGDRLWHEKYAVQETMVPCFITLAQAKKFLATGKSINFLREVCQDYTPVKGRDQLRHVLDSTSVEALFLPEREGDLQTVMDTAYLEISRRVLDVLNGPHMFMENLQALRRYLLLGQGDFIRHLMEIIDPELQKDASKLYPHNLSGILETAIRSTNAQFEDIDILQRLDVRMLESSPGDSGWDVFTLDYHVMGPIGTIFGPTTNTYLMLFNALWRSKRMEYILSVTWKRQVTSTKMLRKLPELAPILQSTHLLTAEMIHLVHQMQYYTLFEVLECSWDTLIREVQHADALDDIITAHNRFLTKVKMGALLDDDSQELSAQLRAVYDLILQLQRLEEQLHNRSLTELQKRSAREDRIACRSQTGEYGTSAAEEEEDEMNRQEFVHEYLPYVHAQLRVLTKSYQDVVKKFLLLLANHPDVSLQLLSVRLDFNEHYKRSDSRLAVPYTYQHRRLSELAYKPTAK